MADGDAIRNGMKRLDLGIQRLRDLIQDLDGDTSYFDVQDDVERCARSIEEARDSLHDQLGTKQTTI